LSLQVRQAKVHFDGVRAVDGVDLHLWQQEVLGLIGPNGAGKSTLLNALSGHERMSGGSVLVAGREVTGRRPHQIARLGLARTFQSVRLFGRLTVRENVELGPVGLGVRRKEARQRADELIELFGLRDRADQFAEALPQGAERRVGIARALAMRPKLLLMDEPAAGLSEPERDELVTIIDRIRSEFACAVLLIEHDMRMVMKICDRVQVINQGRTISVGNPAHVRSDPAVIEAYLGGERREASDA
jgi:branched-chain amino acid transport system ATP-binding protein